MYVKILEITLETCTLKLHNDEDAKEASTKLQDALWSLGDLDYNNRPSSQQDITQQPSESD